MDAAIVHCTKGVSIWEKASTDKGGEPDVVMACAGDIPTKESLAATDMLRKEVPDLKIRFVNVVDLFKIQPDPEHRPAHAAVEKVFHPRSHGEQADHLRVPRLPVADPPAGVPAQEPPEPARPRV